MFDLLTPLPMRPCNFLSREDNLALSEAADVPYWAPHPTSVTGHRAAEVLRSEADRLLSGSNGSRR